MVTPCTTDFDAERVDDDFMTTFLTDEGGDMFVHDQGRDRACGEAWAGVAEVNDESGELEDEHVEEMFMHHVGVPEQTDVARGRPVPERAGKAGRGRGCQMEGGAKRQLQDHGPAERGVTVRGNVQKDAVQWAPLEGPAGTRKMPHDEVERPAGTCHREPARRAHEGEEDGMIGLERNNGMKRRRKWARREAAWARPMPAHRGQRRGDHGGRDWTAAERLGEAANPGPGDAQREFQPWQRLRSTDRGGTPTIQYPRPGRQGFRDFTAPGFSQGGRHPSDGEFQLVVESANTTGWAALKRRPVDTDAHALLAQETWVTQSMMPAASAWARRRGWKSLWSPAAAGLGGGPSAGVAIPVRDYLGMRFPDVGGHEWHPARAVAAVMEAPGFRPLLLSSIYLISGGGTDRGNLAILADVGAKYEAQGEGWLAIMGGDFNVTPNAITDVGFDRQIDASVMYPLTERGTFRTSSSSSLIDFFLVSDRLAAAVDDVRTVEAARLKAHVPVRLSFRSKVTAVKALHLRKPPALALDRVYGPLPEPPSWEAAKEDAEAALAAARGRRDDAAGLLETAHKPWANTVERELEQDWGCSVKKRGIRGDNPNLVWRSIVPEKGPCRQHPREAATNWLRNVTMELQRIGANAKAAMNRADDDEEDSDDDEPPGLCDASDSDSEDEETVHVAATTDDGARATPDATEVRLTTAVRAKPGTVAQCRAMAAEIVGSLQHDLPDGDLPAEVKEAHGAVTLAAMEVVTALSTKAGQTCGSGGMRTGTSGDRPPSEVGTSRQREG